MAKSCHANIGGGAFEGKHGARSLPIALGEFRAPVAKGKAAGVGDPPELKKDANFGNKRLCGGRIEGATFVGLPFLQKNGGERTATAGRGTSSPQGGLVKEGVCEEWPRNLMKGIHLHQLRGPTRCRKWKEGPETGPCTTSCSN